MRKINIKKTIAILIAGVTLLGTSVGCGKQNVPKNDSTNKNDSATQTNSTKKDEELTEITLVLDWTPNTNHTGFYVAQAKGYFEDAGLKVNIVQPPEGGATNMVASGQAQFGIDFQDYLTPVFTSDEKIPVIGVAAILQHNTSGIISLKEDGIDSPKGLEGKNYATWDLPIEKAMLKNIVEEDGGDFSKVNLIPEYIENEPAALQQDIDAIWVYYAWAGISCKQAGLDTNMIYFKDINPAFDFYSPIIITNSDWAKENPELEKAFLAATSKGYEFAIENPDEAAELFVEQVPELDKKLVTESQQWISAQYKADATQWGYIDQARWDAFYKWLSDNNLSDEIPAGYGFTNEYLPEINK